MSKSPEAFRTISEVAEALETPAHVLRFWESRFPQIRPVKRAGGRRYYRPADVALLGGIKRLLHDEGLTIRGVQKILREQGVRHVAGLSGEGAAGEVWADPGAGRVVSPLPPAAPARPPAEVRSLDPGPRPPTAPPRAVLSPDLEAGAAGLSALVRTLDALPRPVPAQLADDLAEALARAEILRDLMAARAQDPA